MKKLLISLVLLVVMGNVYAESYNETNETIIIIATKNPQNAFDLPMMTSKIDMKSPQYTNSTNLSDVFRNTPGLEVVGGPVRNAQQFSLRGYDANNIIFLLDGTRQNFNSQHNSNIFLDPSILKHVEVLQGSSSAIYGSGGLGGVISFETKDAADLLKKGQKIGFMQKFGYFSGNHEKSSVSTLYGASDKVDVVANVALRDSGTIKLSDGTNFDKSDNAVQSGLLKVNYAINQVSKLKFNVQGYKNKADEFTNPSLANGDREAIFTNKHVTSHTAKLAYEYNPSKFVNFITQVYNSDTEIKYDYKSQKQRTNTLGFDIQNVSSFDVNENFTNRLTYGLNYFQNKQTSASAGSVWGLVPEGYDDVGGLFIQNEMKAVSPIGEFSVIPAVRYDDYKSKGNNAGVSANDHALSPRLALGYKPAKWLNLFASAGRAFRAPTVSEKYSYGQHFVIPMGPMSYVNQFISNPNLKAETNTTYEAGFGLKFGDVLAQNDSFQFKSAYYRTKAKDYINQVVDTSGIGTCFVQFGCTGSTYYTNIDSATITGVDATAEYKVQKFLASVGYSQVNGKDDKTGLYTGSLLPKMIRTNVAYEVIQGTNVGFRSTFASEFDQVNTGGTKIAGYGVHDIYAQYDLKDSFSLALSVNNLLNKAYRRPNTANYEISRDFRVTVAYKY